MIRWNIFLLLMVMACFSCNRPCTQAALSKTFQQKNDWLVSENSQELKNLALPELLYTHSNCWTEENDEFLSPAVQKELFYKSIVLDSAKYIVADRTGIVRGDGTFNINHKGKDVSIHLCFTETYVCRDGAWKLFSRHAAKL